MAPHCESATCPLHGTIHYVTDPGCEDYADEVAKRPELAGRLLTGGDSGEHRARELLLRALGPGWNIEQTIAHGEPDELRITTPRDSSFVVKADRLYLGWEQSADPGARIGHTPNVDLGDVLTLYVREGSGLLRPWWGTMSHGIFNVGDAGAGGGVWRARTRPRLVRKMAAAAARMGFAHGSPTAVLIEVRDGR